jgi:beta-lactam-binding protein with PASTA domain
LDFQKQPKPEYKWKSAWSPNIQVPKLVGMTIADAQKAIAESGFKVAIVERYDPYAPASVVVGQTPGAGSKITQGGTITLYVSKGQEAKPVPEPQPQPEPEPEQPDEPLPEPEPTPDTTPTP